MLESSYPHPVGGAAEGAEGLFYWLNEALFRVADLWFTDGTDEGTVQLLPDDVTLSRNFVPTADYLYFKASDAMGNSSVWRSDGTVDGTVDLGEPTIRLRSIDGDDVYYQGYDANGYELWRTNGTITGTFPVSDVVPTSLDDRSFGAYPSPIHQSDDGVLFGVNDGEFGKELWRSNGTEEGTTLVRDIDATPRGLSLSHIVPADDVTYMIDGWNHILGHRYSIMKSNGQASGTELVKSFERDPNLANYSIPKALFTIDNTLYYLHADDIWKSDGTASGTTIVVESGVRDLYAFNGNIYFSKDDELWRTDGTVNGAILIKDFQLAGLYDGVDTGSWLAAGSSLYFVVDAPDGGKELWKSDGTASGTVAVKRSGEDGAARSYPDNLFYDNSLLYFADHAGDTFDRGLWVTDGTKEGTRLVYSAETDLSPSGFAVIFRPATTRSTAGDSLMLFSAHSQAHGYELWRTNGTAEGTELVLDIFPELESSRPENITSMGSYILFVASDSDERRGLWRSDGTANGTQLIADLQMGTEWPVQEPLLRIGDFLYFSADDGTHGFELWRTDGTEAGTVMIADLYQGEAGSNPRNLTYRDGMLYFSANNGISGEQLFSIPVEAPLSLSTIEEPTLDFTNFLPFFSQTQP